MGAFIIVARGRDDRRAADLSSELAARAAGHGMQVSELNSHAWLAVRGPHPPGHRRIGAWTLIGDVFDRRSPRLPATGVGDLFAYERKLLARIWGRYVGIRFGPKGDPEALLRDPSGALECITWVDGGLTVACSAVEDWLIERLRPKWRIDPRKVADAIRDPLSGIGPLLLDGPKALLPGVLQPFPLDNPATPLWSPGDFARTSLGPAPSAEQAAQDLRDAVDEAVSGLGGLPGPLACEVSGGLDSSIIAAGLVHAGCGVGLWLNAYGATPEADERSYVDALAARLSIARTLAPHAAGAATQAGLESLSPDFRPGLNGMDRAHDQDWVRRLQAAGMTALMTGRGGDSILFNRAGANIFVDEWLRRPWKALWSPDMAELATANEVSIWTFLSRAFAYRKTGPTRPRRRHPVLTSPDAPLPLHPWIEDWTRFGPAKAAHVAGVIDNVARHGPSTLTDAVDVRNPLCAQPVIEACLSLPTSVLTLGGRERGLARRAFSDRLPAQILDRRSKGDMTRVYGRFIFDSLPVLRPWLIEGRLAAMGIIDPIAAEACLTRESLAWHGAYTPIMVAAAFESWVRAWERRLAPSP
ncbi:asparagine synthase-related protein [Brevundimonas sp. NPDC092305]|uniref:asparagine synthase-related protein n=1 Tax=Brevundimonas sp. NPDC092305 TaxID=3363957 RepID=UPI00380C8E93